MCTIVRYDKKPPKAIQYETIRRAQMDDTIRNHPKCTIVRYNMKLFEVHKWAIRQETIQSVYFCDTTWNYPQCTIVRHNMKLSCGFSDLLIRPFLDLDPLLTFLSSLLSVLSHPPSLPFSLNLPPVFSMFDFLLLPFNACLLCLQWMLLAFVFDLLVATSSGLRNAWAPWVSHMIVLDTSAVALPFLCSVPGTATSMLWWQSPQKITWLVLSQGKGLVYLVLGQSI